MTTRPRIAKTPGSARLYQRAVDVPSVKGSTLPKFLDLFYHHHFFAFGKKFREIAFGGVIGNTGERDFFGIAVGARS